MSKHGDLSDSGNQEVVTPSPSDSSERVRGIARDEASREVKMRLASHAATCENAAGLWEEIGKMRDANTNRDKLIAEFVGAQKLARWLVPVVTGVASSALAVFLLRAVLAGAGR